MTPRSTMPRKPYIADPRRRPDFTRAHFPDANGHESPKPGTRNRAERVQVEFLSAYYQLNREYARLIEVRTARPSAQRVRRERQQLQRIERALRRRDALEDHYAPSGVIAEPEMRDGFAVNVRFTLGSVDLLGRMRSRGIVASAYIPIPLPPGSKVSDFIRVIGPPLDSG